MNKNLPTVKAEIAFVFPGQGSQFIGMGKGLSDQFSSAQDIFEQVNEALEMDLTRIMWEGTEEELNLTENTQPALLAVSCAIMAVLKTDFGFDITEFSYVGGHSLGEYSALVAAESLSVQQAAKLVRLRGQAMQRAVPVGRGAMAALLGADLAKTEELCCAEAGICEVANDNAIGQIVISGERVAIERIVSIARESGIKKAVLLPVSAPFHCTMMQPAAYEMQEALMELEIKKPVLPVVSNVEARKVLDPEQIRTLLIQQITQRVRWRESINYMVEHGVKVFIECGAGKILTQMLKRITKEAKGFSLINPQELDNIIKNYLTS